LEKEKRKMTSSVTAEAKREGHKHDTIILDQSQKFGERGQIIKKEVIRGIGGGPHSRRITPVCGKSGGGQKRSRSRQDVIPS